MTDPRHIGPPCKRCGRPQATQAAWDELQGGEGEELCWGDDTPACDMACATVPVAELAALREVAEAAEEHLVWGGASKAEALWSALNALAAQQTSSGKDTP